MVGIAAVAVVWLLLGYPMRRTARHGRTEWITVHRDMTVVEVASLMSSHRFVDDEFLFATYARVLGAEGRMREGAVYLTDGLNPREVLQRVATGFGTSTVRITVPEGFTRFDIADRLARFGVVGRDEFLRATEDVTLLRELGIEGPTAEGYLFPDTYDLGIGTSAPLVVRRFVRDFHARVDGVLAATAGTPALTARQVLILASMVEKEAQARAEQTIIAGVFMNRLRDATMKRLESDPTAAYGCKENPRLAPSCATFDGRHVTAAMTRDAANPYNTYRREGLPPGPICSPGLPAIRAALAPAAHDYLFFVASGGGRHRFTRTFAEHNVAVDAYRTRVTQQRAQP